MTAITTTPAAIAPGQIASRSNTRTVAGVPRWAERAAHLAVLSALPSSLWRLPMAFGATMGFDESFIRDLHAPGWGSVYVVMLGVFSETFAFLTFGLIRPWGETWPRWIPFLRDRRVPVAAGVTIAAIGSVLVLLYSTGLIYMTFFHTGADSPTGWWLVLMNSCYLPLLAWAPLLAAVTVHYSRRRRAVQTTTAA